MLVANVRVPAVVEYSSIQDMQERSADAVGSILTSGATVWEVVADTTPLPLNSGLYATPRGAVYLDDYAGTGTEKIQFMNAYSTFLLKPSYPDATSLERDKYAAVPVEFMFTSTVTSSEPIQLMRHVHYNQVGAQAYFNRDLKVGFYYAPSNLESAATEPVVYILQNGVYVRKTGALIGTPDNNITDVNGYITFSDGFLFDLSVACTGGVKVGLNFSMSPGCKGTKTSIGITQRGGNSISAPLLGMYFRWSWGADFRSPKVLAMRQGIHLYLANAGLRITNPYVARVGVNASNETLVYSTPELISNGKNQNTGITSVTARDYVIDEPIVEWWRQAFAFQNSDCTVRKPHVEDVGGNMIMQHNFVIINSYLDIDNWSQINYTCLSYGIYFGKQDGSDRHVLLRGMPAIGGFTNGLVGGTFSNTPLIVDYVSTATTDYGKIGDWAAIASIGLTHSRQLFVNATTGSDINSGFTASKAVATLERAIEIVNKSRVSGSFSEPFVINVSSDLTLTRQVIARKSFRLLAAGSIITSSASAYISLAEGVNVEVTSGTLAGTAALFYQKGLSAGVFITGTAVISTPAILTSAVAGIVSMQVIGGNSSGILKYVDGPGRALVHLMVRAPNRNTGIDDAPVSANQFAAAYSITS